MRGTFSSLSFWLYTRVWCADQKCTWTGSYPIFLITFCPVTVSLFIIPKALMGSTSKYPAAIDWVTAVRKTFPGYKCGGWPGTSSLSFLAVSLRYSSAELAVICLMTAPRVGWRSCRLPPHFPSPSVAVHLKITLSPYSSLSISILSLLPQLRELQYPVRKIRYTFYSTSKSKSTLQSSWH